MSTAAADRNLLFGLLALQNDFISREDLLVVAGVWLQDKNQQLDQIMIERKLLADDEHALLSQLVAKHLARHGNDPQKSLGAVNPVDAAFHRQLRKLGDDEIAKSLGGVAMVAPQDKYTTMVTDAGDSSPTMSRYRVLRPYATGGLGEVSVAEDEELHREVALKEIQEHFSDDPRSRARFILEAEITGSLEHPGVVPVYGLGQYPDGRPYYAMRLIRGSNFEAEINRFHKGKGAGDFSTRNLELRRLLRHFTDICNAMEYAHSRGVIHRDLKPENVMIGKYGETLIVDWGLAKSTGRADIHSESDEKTLVPSGSGSVQTLIGSAIGTPPFMSPEQAAGRLDEMGPASDVCSLGCVLYCLLTGERPYTGGSTDVILRKVQEGDFTPPSEAKRGVPKPLSAICMKAMAVRPRDRYSTPSALRDDIEHWLADESVSAHQENFTERAGRWMRRHRTLMQAAAVSLVLIAVIAAMAAAFVNAARQRAVKLADANRVLAEENEKRAVAEADARAEADRRRDEAMQRLRQARDAVDSWITGGSEALKFYPGVQEARRNVLRKAAEDYEKFAAQQSDDVELERERGRVYLRLGDVHQLLGEVKEAEEAFRKAEKVLARFPNDAGSRRELANSRMKMGLVLVDRGQNREADAAYQAAVEQLQALVKDKGDEPPLVDALASGLLNRGVLLIHMGRLAEAETTTRESIRRFDDLTRRQQGEPRYLAALSKARVALGRIFLKKSQLEEALEQFNRGVAGFDSALADDANNFDYVESRATARLDTAAALSVLGRYNEQLAAYQSAVADYQRLATALYDVPRYQEHLALARIELGRLLHTKFYNARGADEQLALAAAYFQKQVPDPNFKQETVPDHHSPLHYEGLGTAYAALAQLYADLGENDNARVVLDRAMALFQKLAATPDGDPRYRERLAAGQSQYGQLLYKLGQNDAAQKSFGDAIKTLQNLLLSESSIPRYHDAIALTYAQLGALQQAQGQTDAARETSALAIEQWEKLATQSPAPEYLFHYAELLVECPDTSLRQPPRAVELLKTAIAKAPENAFYHGLLGAAHYRAGELPLGVAAIEHAAQLRGEGNGHDLYFLAMLQVAQNMKDDAKQNYDAAVKWMQANRPDSLELGRLRSEAENLVGVAGETP